MRTKVSRVLLAVFAPILLASCVGMGHGGWAEVVGGDDGASGDAAQVPADTISKAEIAPDGAAVDGHGEMSDMSGAMDDGGMMGSGKHVGDGCFMAMPCPAGGSGTKGCETAWPGGYCLVEGCAEHDHDCPSDGQPGGSTCVLFDGAKCLAVCSAATDCREGYACAAAPDTAGHGTVSVCVPE